MIDYRLTGLAVVALGLISGSSTLAATYHIDDDAPGDPGPGDSTISDPLEDGTIAHPFDDVQEAIVASADGDLLLVQPGTYFGQLDLLGKAITVASVMGPESTVLDGARSGRVIRCTNDESASTLIDGFTITHGYGGNLQGGGLSAFRASPTISNCVFTSNTAVLGGGFRGYLSSARFYSCTFLANGGTVDAPAVISYGGFPSFTDVDFIEHHGGSAVIVDADPAGSMATFESCRFIRNSTSSHPGGAAVFDAASSVYINCVFSRNEALGLGRGAISAVRDITLINCTISHNSGAGVTATSGLSDVTMYNCIVWGNSEGAFALESDPPTDWAKVYDSDIQGGWTGPGSGNMDADPLFVQAGTDNVRLSLGSPCVDAGVNGHLPAGITTDVDGNNRFVNAITDLGAYEGMFDPLPIAASAYYIAPGAFTALVPDISVFAPFDHAAMIILNLDVNAGSALVTLNDDDTHSGAGGHTTPGRSLSLETTLPPGTFRSVTTIPITAADFAGFDPALLDLTVYAPSVDNWALAVSANMANAPNDDDPIGERHFGTTGQIPSPLGDYGVVWNTATQKGFVWANVDRAGDFSFGVPLCPSDCAQPPNGTTGVEDLLAVYGEWSGDAGPFDVNNDGVVDALDVLGLIAGWGVCPN